MRVMARTETAAREMLADKVHQGLMTPQDASRLFNYAFSQVVATLGNWRHRNATNQAIEAAIGRRIRAARTALAQAPTQNKRNLAARDLIVAQMFAAVWKGMQDDVAAYQQH